jgi:restriction endonuclease S subunit
MLITVANFSETIKNDRLDAQFFHPEYTINYNIIRNKNYNILSDVAQITDGNHLTIAENYDFEKGIRYLRGQDLGSDMMLSDRNIVYIPEKTYNTLKRSHIKKNDILITIVGANTGLIGLVYSPPEKLIANCKLGIARFKQGKISPGYLYAYLTCRYGQHQILRSIRGGGQTGLILPDMRQLLIARLDSYFETIVNNLVFLGHQTINDSRTIYENSQALLISELGLINWKPKHSLSYIRNFSDTKEAERFDSEYFQPKYDEIVDAIKNYPSGWDRLGNQFKLNKSTFKKIDGKIYKYLEISGVNVSTGEIEPIELEVSDLPANAKIKLKINDIIISKVRTYRGAVAIIRQDDLIASGAFTVLQVNGSVTKETMFTLLKSLPFTQFSLKFNTGTSYPTIVDEDILNYPIPLFEDKIQKTIHDKIIESIELQQKSKTLLQIAKKGVEMAIECNEETAEKWLKEEVYKLGIELDTTRIN